MLYKMRTAIHTICQSILRKINGLIGQQDHTHSIDIFFVLCLLVRCSHQFSCIYLIWFFFKYFFFSFVIVFVQSALTCDLNNFLKWVCLSSHRCGFWCFAFQIYVSFFGVVFVYCCCQWLFSLHCYCCIKTVRCIWFRKPHSCVNCVHTQFNYY